MSELGPPSGWQGPGGYPPPMPPPGWWQASDGRWYPPETHPANFAPLRWSGPPPGSYPPAKWCPACGMPLFPSAVVCPQCGTPLAAPRSKGVAVILAVFLGFWTWLYTYRLDKAKFWVGLGCGIIGAFTMIFLIGIPIVFGVWLWAVIDTAVKPEGWYQQYPVA